MLVMGLQAIYQAPRTIQDHWRSRVHGGRREGGHQIW